MSRIRTSLSRRTGTVLRPVRWWLDRRTVRAYLAAHPVRKLHIGSGTYHEEGWLNSDLEPATLGDIVLDATRPFPLPSDSFAFIYSEHMIEHVPYAGGRAMLSECLRVLAPGGVLRIATPRLGFLLDLCGPERSDLEEAYIRWAIDTFGLDAPSPRASFVFNNFVRAWGHRFIYDEDTLSEAMRRTGFAQVTVCAVGESGHEALRDREHEERLPPGFLRLETMVLEGTKPKS